MIGILRRGCFALLATVCLLGMNAARLRADDNTLTPEEKKNGWILLFNGKNMDGWDATGKPGGWTVEDGAITWSKGAGYAYTKEKYADYILTCDFKVDDRVNSGIFVRWEDIKDPVNSGMEIQILDSFGRLTPDKHDCGALYDIVAPSVDAARPAGEWNHIEIYCRGPILKVVLNQQLIVAVDLTPWTTPGMNPDGSKNKFTRAYATMLQAGHIGLQDHGGKVVFKNMKLRPLPKWQTPVHG
jgi:hypothetical protein